MNPKYSTFKFFRIQNGILLHQQPSIPILRSGEILIRCSHALACGFGQQKNHQLLLELLYSLFFVIDLYYYKGYPYPATLCHIAQSRRI